MAVNWLILRLSDVDVLMRRDIPRRRLWFITFSGGIVVERRRFRAFLALSTGDEGSARKMRDWIIFVNNFSQLKNLKEIKIKNSFLNFLHSNNKSPLSHVPRELPKRVIDPAAEASLICILNIN